MKKDTGIICNANPIKVSKLMTLDTAFEYYRAAVDVLAAYVNQPGKIQRRPMGFGAYCDRLRVKGWRIL